jgi:hypothetical protein
MTSISTTSTTAYVDINEIIDIIAALRPQVESYQNMALSILKASETNKEQQVGIEVIRDLYSAEGALTIVDHLVGHFQKEKETYIHGMEGLEKESVADSVVAVAGAGAASTADAVAAGLKVPGRKKKPASKRKPAVKKKK